MRSNVVRLRAANIIFAIYYAFPVRQILLNGYSYKDHKGKSFAKPQVKTEYDALQPEYDIIRAMIDARLSQNITQKELAARTGITQADISRIENGTRNPSLSMMKRLAQGLGMQSP